MAFDTLVTRWIGPSDQPSAASVVIGPRGAAGEQGDKGDPADEPAFTVAAETLTPGSAASVDVSGVYPDLLLTFGIPRGNDAQAPAFTFDVTTLSPGSDAALAVTGAYPDLSLTFGVPSGETGLKGDKGDQGATGDVADRYYAFSAGSAFTIDLSLGTMFKCPTNANATVTLPTPVGGKNYSVLVAYGGIHGLTFTGGGTLKWEGGAAPTPQSLSGKFDLYVFTCDGDGNTYGGLAGRF